MLNFLVSLSFRFVGLWNFFVLRPTVKTFVWTEQWVGCVTLLFAFNCRDGRTFIQRLAAVYTYNYHRYNALYNVILRALRILPGAATCISPFLCIGHESLHLAHTLSADAPFNRRNNAILFPLPLVCKQARFNGRLKGFLVYTSFDFTDTSNITELLKDAAACCPPGLYLLLVGNPPNSSAFKASLGSKRPAFGGGEKSYHS